jgi:predicted lipid-binding transport protein (Tim44 family)
MWNSTVFRPMVVLASIMIFFVVQNVSAQSHQYNRPSPSDCDAYASNYAQNYSGSMLGGAVRGSAGGALFGAIVGGKKSAKRGAVLGGVVGGARRGINREHIRSQAYNDCMAGRVRW